MLRSLIVIAILLVVPVASFAQDATLTGTVKDTSGGVLPGVTVTALHEATGNTFVAITDSVGAFRLPVRTGSYRVTVELAGFATIVRSVNLLLGQIAAVDLQLSPSTVQESVTVTRRSAADRHAELGARGQHRSEADAGAADQRP